MSSKLIRTLVMIGLAVAALAAMVLVVQAQEVELHFTGVDGGICTLESDTHIHCEYEYSGTPEQNPINCTLYLTSSGLIENYRISADGDIPNDEHDSPLFGYGYWQYGTSTWYSSPQVIELNHLVQYNHPNPSGEPEWEPVSVAFQPFWFDEVNPPGVYAFDLYLAEINGVPVGGGECMNDDSELISSTVWSDIESPTWITDGGVLLDYGDGVQQSVIITEPGNYAVSISTTLALSYPVESAYFEVCMSGYCALAPVFEDYIPDTLFRVTGSGSYDLAVINRSSSIAYTDTVTLTLICLAPIGEEQCHVLDPDLDNIKYLSSDLYGWQTMFDDVSYTDGDTTGAWLNCDKSVEQWVYLDAGTYTMTVIGWASFSSLLGGTSDGSLEVHINASDPTGDYSTYYMDFPSQQWMTRTLTFEIATADDYFIQFANYDCDYGVLSKDGYFLIDYVCILIEGQSVPSRLGQCGSLVDHSFAGYNAQSWDQSGDVEWSPGYISLGEGGAISQTARLSSTSEAWVLYVVAKAAYTSTLQGGLGGETSEWEIAPGNDYQIYQSTLTTTMPVSVSLEALTATEGLDIDFVCVYYPDDVPDGDWENGSDGDTECIQPSTPPGGLSPVDAVQAWLSWIVDWIKYLICLLVLWLTKIWAALLNWVREIAIDLGLDRFWRAFMAWLMQILQGPYDTYKLGEYVLNLLLGLAGRLFMILFSGATMVVMFFSSLLVGLQLLGAMLGTFWGVLAGDCTAQALPVPSALVQGFLLADATLAEIDQLGIVQGVIIGAMAVAILFWTINQFRNLGGGG